MKKIVMNWHNCKTTAEEDTTNYLKIILQIITDEKQKPS